MYRSGACSKPPRLAGGQHRDGVGRSGGAEIGAFQRIDGDIDLGEERFGRVRGESDFFADVQHGRFVALAFADDDGAVHLHRVHGLAHGFHGDFVGFVAVTKTHGARRGDRGGFDYAEKFEAELRFHGWRSGSVTGVRAAALMIGQAGATVDSRTRRVRGLRESYINAAMPVMRSPITSL